MQLAGLRTTLAMVWYAWPLLRHALEADSNRPFLILLTYSAPLADGDACPRLLGFQMSEGAMGIITIGLTPARQMAAKVALLPTKSLAGGLLELS